ncbi:MAG: VOC family protein [Betaproteobacteria bacterium]|nr:VOC family protein [Betaproteobacteria bacterium]
MVTLDHAHLFCSDIARATSYYETMFGARIVYDAMLAGSRTVRLEIGSAALHLYDQPPSGSGRPLVHHLGLRTDDLIGLVAHMRAHGAVFRKDISEETAFRYVMCEAPDGLLLELYEVKLGGEWMLG